MWASTDPSWPFEGTRLLPHCFLLRYECQYLSLWPLCWPPEGPRFSPPAFCGSAALECLWRHICQSGHLFAQADLVSVIRYMSRSKNLHSPSRWAEAVRSAVKLVLARASEPPTNGGGVKKRDFSVKTPPISGKTP